MALLPTGSTYLQRLHWDKNQKQIFKKNDKSVKNDESCWKSKGVESDIYEKTCLKK